MAAITIPITIATPPSSPPPMSSRHRRLPDAALGVPGISAPVPNEYPKWVGDVLVNSAEEEFAVRTVSAEAAAAVRATELARQPSPAAIRMRRTRERRRDGKLRILYEISTDQIEALALAGFIDPTKQDDAAEVAQALVTCWIA